VDGELVTSGPLAELLDDFVVLVLSGGVATHGDECALTRCEDAVEVLAIASVLLLAVDFATVGSGECDGRE